MNWRWRSDTHDAVAEAAMNACPESLRETALHPLGRPYFRLGVQAPDRLFQDASNHYYNCTPSASGRHVGWVHEKVRDEIALIGKMVATPDKVVLHPRASFFLRGILNSPYKAVCFELGTCSHYIADAFQPLHTDGKARCKKEEIPHKLYEFDVCRWPRLAEIVALSSTRTIQGPVEEIVAAAEWANQYYMTIIDAYLKPDGGVRSFASGRFNAVQDLTFECLSRAASLMRDLWLSIPDLADTLELLLRKERLVETARSRLCIGKSYRVRSYKTGSLRFTAQR